MAVRRVLFLVGSGRMGGNTETLARRAAVSLPGDTQQRWIHLDDYPLPRFVDYRHEPWSKGVFPSPTGNEAVLLEETVLATDIVFVVPLYWYALPAAAKLYLDYWTAWLRVEGADFKTRMRDNILWVICAMSDEDRNLAQPLVETLRLSSAYLGMTWGGTLLGYGSRPGDVLNDAEALAAAASFFGGGKRP